MFKHFKKIQYSNGQLKASKLKHVKWLIKKAGYI